MSGAGKATLCDALRTILKPRLPELVVLDGDVIRATFGTDLGYAEHDRKVQISPIGNLAHVSVGEAAKFIEFDSSLLLFDFRCGGLSVSYLLTRRFFHYDLMFLAIVSSFVFW